MCSRFELNENARVVVARFGLTVPPPLPNKAEVRPTDPALVIGPAGAGQVQGRILHWGLDVPWDKRPLINARAETLAGRFKRLLGARVLVPATSWWEWRKEADGKTKTKMRLGRADGGMFALAGLVEDGRFTIVTCAPAPSIAHIHDRMPLVLSKQAEAAWLDPAVPVEDMALGPYEGDLKAEMDVAMKPKQADLFG